MGGFGGKQFIRNDKVDGQGKPVLLISKKLNMKMNEVDRIFHEFSKYEDQTTHTIEIKYLFNCMQIPYMLFDSLIFQMFDKQKSGYLNFMDYLMVMWALLSTDDDGLANLCFSLFDTEESGSLHATIVKYLINTVWEFKPNNQTLSAMRKLDQNRDGFVVLSEFVLLSRHFPDMLWPLKQSRFKLRKKTVFTRFWRQLMNRRIKDFGPATVFHIMEMNDPGYVQSSMNYLNLQSDIVPSQFVEQYRMTLRRRQASQKGETRPLPYEILTNQKALKSEVFPPVFMNRGNDPMEEEQKEEDELIVAKILTKVKIKDKKLLKAQRNKNVDIDDGTSSSAES
jgi:Ca2+-binding EF-hand superfamily protein